MIKMILFIRLFLIFGSAISSEVLEYKEIDFDAKITSHDIALVEFYAPWCGHCKQLAPEYEKAATLLKKNDPYIPLIKVDCTIETAVCGDQGVSGYPTLKIFKNGVPSEYNGPREADGIAKHMRLKSAPISRELNTIEDIEKFLNNYDHSVIGFFSFDSSLSNEFMSAAEILNERFRFAHTFKLDLLVKYGYEEKIVIFQPPRLRVKLESIKNVYTGPVTKTRIKNFIENEIHGLVGHRHIENQEDFNGPIVIILFNVDYVKDLKGTNYIRNRILKVAKKLKEEKVAIRFAISNVEEFRKELIDFGFTEIISDEKYVIARGAKSEKYKLDTDFTFESLDKFSRDLAAGKLEAYLKSEPIPESNNEPVKIVVAKNFDQIVNDVTKDVLIEVYAPWCVHCKSLSPKYEELANKLAKEKNILIAKIDATSNDIPTNFEIEGYPTIFFVPKKNKKIPKIYEGNHEVVDFINYIAKHSTEPLIGYSRDGKKNDYDKIDL